MTQDQHHEPQASRLPISKILTMSTDDILLQKWPLPPTPPLPPQTHTKPQTFPQKVSFSTPNPSPTTTKTNSQYNKPSEKKGEKRRIEPPTPCHPPSQPQRRPPQVRRTGPTEDIEPPNLDNFRRPSRAVQRLPRSWSCCIKPSVAGLWRSG